MKKILALTLIMGILSKSDAQLLKKIVDKTKQKTEHKISEKVSEKVSDAASKPIDEAGKPKDKNKDKSGKDNSSSNNNNSATQQGGEGAASGASSVGLATYSKYDFVPGEKILVVEDFAQDAVGDFPGKWNTNSTGEVVTASGQQGHWLMLNKKGRFIPEFITNLPDNFTLQFDLLCNDNYNYYSNYLDLFLLSGGSKDALEPSTIVLDKRSGVKIGFHPSSAGSNGGQAHITTYENGAQVINNEVGTKQFVANKGKTKVRVSIWRQKQRIRVYVNEEKVFDLPRAFATGKTFNMAMFELWSGMHTEDDRYLVNNITLAIGAPDTRNKLITEGKFVTTGILFDVNSDKIKPESYGVLKDISTVLSENPDVKVKIIGHTDSDGKDADNLDLSKRRADAVKSVLKTEFKIDASRLETDGKGESQAVDKNDSPAGKANNRRVEFIKL